MGYPAFDNSVLFEYLASHGYVVVAAPSTGPEAGRMPRCLRPGGPNQGPRVPRGVSSRPCPTPIAERIGTAGFSWGGLSSILFALRNARVRAVISLDGAVREEQSLAIARTFPQFKPERLRVPMLVFTGAPTRGPRTRRRVVPGPGQVRRDHAGRGFRNRPPRLRVDVEPPAARRQGRAGRDWSPATAGYEAICKLTLEFLDTRLKGGRRGVDSRPRARKRCNVSTRKAEKAPPDLR